MVTCKWVCVRAYVCVCVCARVCVCLYVWLCVWVGERETDRQTDRQGHREGDRDRKRQVQRETMRQTFLFRHQLMKRIAFRKSMKCETASSVDNNHGSYNHVVFCPCGQEHNYRAFWAFRAFRAFRGRPWYTTENCVGQKNDKREKIKRKKKENRKTEKHPRISIIGSVCWSVGPSVLPSVRPSVTSYFQNLKRKVFLRVFYQGSLGTSQKCRVASL